MSAEKVEALAIRLASRIGWGPRWDDFTLRVKAMHEPASLLLRAQEKIEKVLREGDFKVSHALLCNALKPNCNCGLNDLRGLLTDLDAALKVVERG